MINAFNNLKRRFSRNDEWKIFVSDSCFKVCLKTKISYLRDTNKYLNRSCNWKIQGTQLITFLTKLAGTKTAGKDCFYSL